MREEGAYIKNTFARMCLQQIRDFVLYGSEACQTETENYHMRLRQGSDPIYRRLESLYPNDETERDKAASDLSLALAAHDAVYMEMGMKTGARLIYQLLLADDQRHT